MGVLVRVVCTGVVPDNDLGTGNIQVDANLEQVPMMVSWVPAFDDDVARGDSVGKLAKFLGPLTDLRFERRQGFHVAEGDLERHGHRESLGGSSWRQSSEHRPNVRRLRLIQRNRCAGTDLCHD
jgi:hypothetical protein